MSAASSCGGPVLVVLNGERHLLPVDDAQRAIDRSAWLWADECLPIRAGSRSSHSGGRAGSDANAQRPGFFGRGHCALELGIVLLRQLGHHFDIHAELLGALAKLARYSPARAKPVTPGCRPRPANGSAPEIRGIMRPPTPSCNEVVAMPMLDRGRNAKGGHGRGGGKQQLSRRCHKWKLRSTSSHGLR